MTVPLLAVKDLRKIYTRGGGLIRKPAQAVAVQSVSFELHEGDILCMVGESGCGKSTIGKILAGVVPPTSGSIFFYGKDMREMGREAFHRASLGIQIIHQDPFASLNPTRTVEQSLSAPLVAHRLARGRAERRKRLLELLYSVGLAPAEEFLGKYPHQLSGGQRQRISVARALTVDPRVLVSDEATSMVDVSLRVGILNTIRELGKSRKMANLFITHDFGVARYFGNGHRIAVMYLGEIVESGPTEDVIQRPQHPYTRMLLSSVPAPDPAKNQARRRMMPRSHEIPDAAHIPDGCSFANRCPFAVAVCEHKKPPVELLGNRDDRHEVACHLAGQLPADARA